MTLELSAFEKDVNSFEKAVYAVNTAPHISGLDEDILDTVKAGVIQNFEFTYELCWKFIKRWLQANSGPICSLRRGAGVWFTRRDGTARRHSDLDMAIVGDTKIDFSTLNRLREAFEDSELPFRVDVLDWHAIAEDFRKVIERHYVVIYPLP